MRSLASLALDWKGKGTLAESTLHQISPYIGRTKPAIATALVEEFTVPGETILDPFCGSGTILLEGWLKGRNVLGADLNPYAIAITRAKLNPPARVLCIRESVREIGEQVDQARQTIDLRAISPWVRSFFHPETLREIVLWFRILKAKRNPFLLGCLLGILHHQRPGFLSYPSSNAVPYLRTRKFPRAEFPEMYEYRNVTVRIHQKVDRMLRRVPPLSRELRHSCYLTDSTSFKPHAEVDAIITSPPYMGELAYGRDNRLRLWFLGISDGGTLDRLISPRETEFLRMIRTCLKAWLSLLRPGGHCVLILGDNYCSKYRATLPDAISSIATREVGGYCVESEYQEPIPETNRVRRGCRGSKNETILVMKAK